MKNYKSTFPLLLILGFLFMLSSCTKEDELLKPVLETTSLSSISAVSAVSGGYISSDGGSDVIARGVCWSTMPNPTIEDSLTINAAGTGAFSSTITRLMPNTTYYVRAYATNSGGTAYGLQMEFTTLEGKALLATTGVSSVAVTTATCGGSIFFDGGIPVFERGVCWSTTTEPTVNMTTKSIDTTMGSNFECKLTGLQPSETYYVRAYLINAAGTFYGDTVHFTTLAPLANVSDIDGNIYHSVLIGTQVWMVENLKTTRYNDGTAIPNVTDNTQWLSMTSGAFCNYDNDAANSNTYGRLYNWYSVVDSRKIAPAGWHVASDEEWETLINYLGGENVAGGKIKEAGTLHWAVPNTAATNVSNFTALPAGHRDNNLAAFRGIESLAIWWTSTEETSKLYSWRRSVDYNYEAISRNRNTKNFGFSVRCIRD